MVEVWLWLSGMAVTLVLLTGLEAQAQLLRGRSVPRHRERRR